MAYKQGYTNAKNALADFITTVCFDELAEDKFENWQLLYPKVDTRDEAISQIISERRATISSTFVPKNEWQNEELFKVTQAHLNNFEEFLIDEFPITSKLLSSADEYSHFILKRIPIDAISIEIKLYEIDNTVSPATLTEIKDFTYNSDKENLLNDEFYIDGENNHKEVLILKSNFSISSDDELLIKIKYDIRPTFEIPLLKTIYDQSAVKLNIKGHQGIFYNNEDLDHLNIMEFYVDVRNKKIILLKETVSLEETEEMIFLITYQTYSNNAMTWYVEFNYPETMDGTNINYNYFEWKFGNVINSDFRIVNTKKEPPIMRCFWHTINKLKAPSADWLPIEYFVSWDDSAISFVFCEDPITDVTSVMHAFNYIGVLGSIKNADYDDIKSNFGSCGSYDLTATPGEGLVQEISANMPRANITFLEKYFDSYYAQTQEHLLLKVNNVPYANYSVTQDMINDMNLLQSMIQQITVGDTAHSTLVSPIKTTSPIGTTTSFYNILQKPTIVDFTLPEATRVMKVPDATNSELKLITPLRVSVATGITIKVPKDGTKITLMKNTNVINTTTMSTITLPMGTEITLLADFTTTNNVNGIINIPTNTTFRTKDGEEYKTTIATQILTDMVILVANVQFTTKDNTEVYAPDPDTVTRIDPLPSGTLLKLITSYVEVKFDMLQEYIVEFHYRDPYLGDMHYDFPSKWFNGSVSKTFTDFSGSTALPAGTVAPILPERMVANSIFENEYDVPAIYSAAARNKLNVSGRLSYSLNNKNNYHKNKITVPEVITNSQSGESWVLDGAQTKDAQIEKTRNSITNICLYPGQIYVGNFCYNKRTMNKCTITLGDNDVSRMRLVLVDASNTVLVPFNGTQQYKNLTISRNPDNGVTIEVDFDNLTSEQVYLKMYKLNNYNSGTSGGYWDDKYYYAHAMNINTQFEYSGLIEQISRITNATSFYWAGWGGNYPNTSYDYFTSVPINTIPTPAKDAQITNLFTLMTIDLNSIHKTFIPNVVGMANMSNIWM